VNIGYLGIILTKLTQNADYEFFLEKYRNYYTTISGGFYLAEYEKLIEVLESTPPAR
jgi:hypothetical protein